MARSRRRVDRLQGANVWLTFAIREGKNREVRNVLEHLGLRVNRLIRVSFGPFQLGELPEGAVEEVRTRHLREQLGERIAKDAEADFTGPIAMAEEPEDEPVERQSSRQDAEAKPRTQSRESRQKRRPQPAAQRAAAQPPFQARGRMTFDPPPGQANVRSQDADPRVLANRRAAEDAKRLMRIVGGRFRGRTLTGPKSQAIRPTSDRTRESIFNILTHAYGDPVTGARVLDLFAGTGAMGLEALSRGAASSLCSSMTARKRVR